MTDLIPPRLADASSTTKLVYLVLDERGPCSMSELRQQTGGCSDRTLQTALEELRELDVLETGPHPRDGRKATYEVTG